MAKKTLYPIPPGEILLEDFMRPLGISINALARAIDVPPNRVSAIVNAERHYGGYGTSPGEVLQGFPRDMARASVRP